MLKIKKLNEFIKERYIYILAYLYLFSSVLLFILGNVKYIISIPVSILLCIALGFAIKNTPKMNTKLFESKKKIIIIIVLISIWVIFGGIGGFVWQNTWDHKFRNAVFMDLVNKDWPVIQDSNALCYYLGFWLPSALVGKIFGLNIGYMFQVIWAALGIFIAYGMICQYLKKVSLINIIILIFYSGLDIFLWLLFSKLPIKEAIYQVLNGKHIELVTVYFNSSSNTTLIFWLYNQIIPFWVGMMLLLQQKNSKSIALIYSLMLLYCPFPLVALIPVMIYLVLKKQDDIEEKNIMKNILKKIKYACTFENILSIVVVIIIGLFLKSNIAANKIKILEINMKTIWSYCCYIFFEYIVFLIFIYKKNYKNPVLNILIIVTFILPFILMGNSYDFARRTCIPLAFYIMLLIMRELQDKSVSKMIKILITIVLCLGAITPMTEIIRTAKNEQKVLKGEISSRSDALHSAFIKNGNECYENFMADTNSVFYKYLAK